MPLPLPSKLHTDSLPVRSFVFSTGYIANSTWTKQKEKISADCQGFGLRIQGLT
jgi:hypothetical protein